MCTFPLCLFRIFQLARKVLSERLSPRSSYGKMVLFVAINQDPRCKICWVSSHLMLHYSNQRKDIIFGGVSYHSSYFVIDISVHHVFWKNRSVHIFNKKCKKYLRKHQQRFYWGIIYFVRSHMVGIQHFLQRKVMILFHPLALYMILLIQLFR